VHLCYLMAVGLLLWKLIRMLFYFLLLFLVYFPSHSPLFLPLIYHPSPSFILTLPTSPSLPPHPLISTHRSEFDRRAAMVTSKKVSVPSEYECPLCHDLMRDAVVIPCCGLSFCDQCLSFFFSSFFFLFLFSFFFFFFLFSFFFYSYFLIIIML
jgi:hypothetical protein